MIFLDDRNVLCSPTVYVDHCFANQSTGQIHCPQLSFDSKALSCICEVE